MTRLLTRVEVEDHLRNLGVDSPLVLEWRPIGILATAEDVARQFQRERGFRFWQSQRRAER